MQLGFPFLFHQRFHCGFSVATVLKSLAEKPAHATRSDVRCRWGSHRSNSGLSAVSLGLRAIKRVHFPTFFRPPQRGGVVQLLQRTLNMLQSRISIIFQMTSSIQDFVSLSDPGTGTFRPRDWQSSAPHLYVTEELSKCSFRLSAGGGPRHLAPVVGGGGSADHFR